MAEKHKNPDETMSLAKKIRENVRRRVEEELAKNGITVEDLPAVELEVDSLSAVDRVSRTSEAPRHDQTADSFWDLGTPKAKVYAKPDFSGHSLTVTDVAGSDPEPEAIPPKTASAEKIIPREEFEAKHGSSGRVVNTVDGYRAIPTSDYRRRTSHKKSAPVPQKRTANPDRFPHRQHHGTLLGIRNRILRAVRRGRQNQPYRTSHQSPRHSHSAGTLFLLCSPVFPYDGKAGGNLPLDP